MSLCVLLGLSWRRWQRDGAPIIERIIRAAERKRAVFFGEDGRICEIAAVAREKKKREKEGEGRTQRTHVAFYTAAAAKRREKKMTSWASVASAAQLAASLALILRFLIVTAAYPITQTTTDEQTFERTTYIVPLSSTENDSDIYRGNLRGIPARPTDRRETVTCSEKAR